MTTKTADPSTEASQNSIVNVALMQNSLEMKQSEGFVRSSFANQQNIHLSNSIRFADAKAGALIAVSGVVLPQTISLLQSEIIAQKTFYIIALITMIISIFIAFLVVLPTAKNSKLKGIIYWENINNYDESEFIQTVKNIETSKYLDAWLQNNYIQAQILTRKFKLLAFSFRACIVAFIFIIASILTPIIIDLF